MIKIIHILEPVSVGGWKKIRLRRITRSSTCVCLRLRNLFSFCFALRALNAHTRASLSRFTLAAAVSPCSIAVLSRSRGKARLPDCELRARRPAYLLPIVPMSVCINLGPDRSCRLAAYAGYVVLRARLPAHQCALA
jgi:hypothetical protein